MSWSGRTTTCVFKALRASCTDCCIVGMHIPTLRASCTDCCIVGMHIPIPMCVGVGVG
ncbi:hypothetical protein PR003_g27418 [Phytophthora rubi]|uniref:Uncharacterized protein n=1 Tax=Phytophthora rubi TaxID=129364 RepID=A0A6A4C1P1_9STRA|nr:hypothetical protein PR003_g27418 [Phytophthora rubi]